METDFTFLKGLSLVADVITIVGLLTAIRFAFLKKYENVLGFRISLFLQYLLRTAIIIVFLTLMVYFSGFIYGYIIVFFKGSDNNFYWESGKEFQHILSYFVTLTFSLSISWVVCTFLWTSSFNLAKDFLNLFLPRNKMFLKQSPTLEIQNATYGTNRNTLNITQALRQMVKDNKLTITANNNIAGDPDYGVGKDLIINYKFGNRLSTITLREHETKTIPEL